jgi:DNA adenine methylase
MQYLGGKSRIAKKLAPIILELAKGRILIEPFCGGLSMTEQLHPVYASDASVPLISLIQAVRNGWEPPDSVSEAEYAYARTLPPTHPAHGFCGFGCSFGGKLWGGYANPLTRQRKATYAATTKRTLSRQLAACASTEFGCCDYLAWKGGASTCFYCDPPYANTTAYRTSIDHAVFWQWCEVQAALGAIVLVSEHSAPAGIADCVLELSSMPSEGLRRRSQTFSTEKLFKVR